MKKFYTFLITCIIGSSLSAQTKIAAEDAGKYFGEKVTVEGRVTGSVYKHATKQTLLNIASSNSTNTFTVVINQSDRRNFSYSPETFLVNKSVNLTGKVIDINGNPGMIATRPEDIRLEFEGGADVEVRPLGFDTFNKFFDED
jgi:DNA/RNA endonuclease YhcR with UshA esterase domain